MGLSAYKSAALQTRVSKDQLTAELARAASTAEKSLQQKALAAAYALTEQLCFMAQSHEDELTADRACGNLCFSPTRARQSFQLTRVQLCRQQSPDKSLQQRELAAAYALMAQFPECSTRASPIQLDAFRTGALQESGFQTGALPAAGSKAALETGFAATAFQDPGTAAAALSAEKLQAEDRITRNFSRTRIDELEETTNFAAIGQELAKYIANLREISQKFSPKNFRELEVIKDNFPQKPDLDACQVELGNSELDIDACQVELGNSQLDTENFDQLTLKEQLGQAQFHIRSLDKSSSISGAWTRAVPYPEFGQGQFHIRSLDNIRFHIRSLGPHELPYPELGQQAA